MSMVQCYHRGDGGICRNVDCDGCTELPRLELELLVEQIPSYYHTRYFHYNGSGAV